MLRGIAAVRALAGVACVICLSLAPVALAQTRPPAPAAQSRCGVFFDRWNIAGLPEGIRLAAGLAHEVSAARVCIAENSIAKPASIGSALNAHQ